jgi:mono/diheme cytochrome c family protein
MKFAAAFLAAPVDDGSARCSGVRAGAGRRAGAPRGALGPPSAGALDGKALFRTKTCVACHGRDGSKAIQNFPGIWPGRTRNT